MQWMCRHWCTGLNSLMALGTCFNHCRVAYLKHFEKVLLREAVRACLISRRLIRHLASLVWPIQMGSQQLLRPDQKRKCLQRTDDWLHSLHLPWTFMELLTQAQCLTQ